jgi:hypothetical protein
MDDLCISALCLGGIGIVFTLVGSKSFEKSPIQPLRARRRLKDEL